MEPVFNTLKDFLSELIGTYSPVTYEVDGINVIASGFAGVDWPYIFSALAFLLVFYCIFRILGSLICK